MEILKWILLTEHLRYCSSSIEPPPRRTLRDAHPNAPRDSSLVVQSFQTELTKVGEDNCKWQ